MLKCSFDETTALFRVRAAQLFNLLPPDVGRLPPLEGIKARLGRFMEQYPDKPPVPGYTTVNDNSLLSWMRTHTMQLSGASPAELIILLPFGLVVILAICFLGLFYSD